MFLKKLFACSTLLGFSTFGFACDAFWEGTTTSWNNTANWSLIPTTTTTTAGCIPGTNPTVNTDSATFSHTPASVLVNQDAGAITLETLSFNVDSWLIQGSLPTTTSSDTITFSSSSSSINSTVSTTPGPELALPVFITGNTQLLIHSNGGFFTFDNLTIQNNATLSIPNQATNAQVTFNANPVVLNSGTLESSNSNPYNLGSGNTLQFTSPITIGAGSNLNNKNTADIDGSNNHGTSLIFQGLTINGGTVLNSNTGNIGTTSPTTTTAPGNTIGAALNATTITVNSGTLTNHHDTGNIDNGSNNQPNVGSKIFFTTMNITGGTVKNESTFASTDTNIGSLFTSTGVGAAINIGSPGGTLLNNDTVRTTTINITTGGTLQGIGLYERAVGGNMTVNNSGGFVEPTDGTTPGTMTIVGNYTQTGGTFVADLLQPSTFSHLLVTTRNQPVATTAQPGGTLHVNFLPGNTVTVNDTFVIISTSGQASLGAGTFSTITTNSTTLVPHVQYIPGPNGEVILSFTAAAPSGLSIPTTYAGSFIQTVLSDINHINSHITIRMQDLRRRFAAQMAQGVSLNYVASADNRILAFNPETEEKQEQLRREVVETEKPRPWNFYFGPTGRAYGEIHSKDGDPGAHFWSVGGLAGFDYAFSEVGIGFMADYERIYDHVKENWGRIDVDEIHASIYLTYAPSCIPLAINAIGGGAYELYHIHRNVGSKVAKGNPEGFGYDALFGFEYALEACNFHFIPLANAQYIYLRAESYDEKGGGASDLHVNSQRIKSLRSSVGFRLNYYNETNEDLIVIPEFYAEWQREYMNRRRGIGIAPIAGIGGTILLPGTGRNIWLGGIDLLFTYRQKFGVEVSYETEYNSLYHDHFFYLGANFRF